MKKFTKKDEKFLLKYVKNFDKILKNKKVSNSPVKHS